MKHSIPDFVNSHKLAVSGAAVAASSTAMMAVPMFAAEPSIAGVAVTTEMLTPLVDGVVANIGVILPVGITLFAIFLGVALIPKIIRHFLK